MDIIGGIAAATEGLKLVNELRKIDHEVDKADLKVKMVDLADKLVDAKSALHAAIERERELLEKIAQLDAALNQRSRLQDDNGLLFELNEDGQRIGKPFCNQCFVKEDRMYRMVETERASGHGYVCNNCNTLIITQKKEQPLPTRGGSGSWMNR